MEIHMPPWDLIGNGYIILYKFNEKFLKNNQAIPSFARDKNFKGFGAVMLVDYKQSNIGPYQELLFIPGKFNHKGRKLSTISRIYVSTNISVVNGIENWAIPKEKAEFKIYQENKCEIYEVSKNKEEIAKFKFKPGKIAFPINTRLLPFPLMQKRKGKYYYTKFTGKGKGKLSIIQEYDVNDKYFPNVTKVVPFAVIKVEDFNVKFSKAQLEDE